MDIFIKSLSICNVTTAKDAVYSCSKLFHWLTIRLQTRLKYDDIEAMMKAALFLDECRTKFGDELQETLVKEYPLYEALFKKYFRNSKDYSVVRIIYEHIMLSKNGFQFVYVLERICEYFLETQYHRIQEIRPPTITKQLSKNKTKLLLIMQRLFQLPPECIEDGFCRVIERVHFTTLGLLFCEKPESPYIDKYTILVQIVAQKLINCNISIFFFRSLFVTISTSNVGLRFYWKCLENPVFSHSLIQFFVLCLGNVTIKNTYDLDQKAYKKYVLSNILLRIHAALAIDSPCRLKLYDRLRDNINSKHFVNLISKINFNCDY